MVDARPVPGWPRMNRLKPLFLMPIPKSMAVSARSWPMVPSRGGNSLVLANSNWLGSQRQRSASGGKAQIVHD